MHYGPQSQLWPDRAQTSYLSHAERECNARFYINPRVKGPYFVQPMLHFKLPRISQEMGMTSPTCTLVPTVARIYAAIFKPEKRFSIIKRKEHVPAVLPQNLSEAAIVPLQGSLVHMWNVMISFPSQHALISS